MDPQPLLEIVLYIWFMHFVMIRFGSFLEKEGFHNKGEKEIVSSTLTPPPIPSEWMKFIITKKSWGSF